MKTFIYLIALFYSFQILALSLQVGETYKLETLANQKVKVGSKKIIEAIDQSDHIVLVAKAPGSTFVHVGTKTLQIQVYKAHQSQFYKQLENLFKKRMGLKVSRNNGKIIISGRLYVFEDWVEISKIATNLNASYSFQAKPTKEVAKEAQLFFEREAKQKGLGAIRMADHLPLSIYVHDKNSENFKRARDFFISFGVKVEKSNQLIQVAPLIKTSVILAEISKEASSTFGIQFPTQVDGEILPKLKGPENILISLKALESKGLGKVLASPTLNCKSGSKAEFHAGGEFPIKIRGFGTQGVQWKKHGVILNVQPTSDITGAIRLSIDMEISLIDTSQVVDNLPALKTNRVSSHFDLKEKTTIALSGLVQETWGKSRSGVLGLSQIPILGNLFRSQNFLNHKSELVIFVTPEIIEPLESQSIQWPKDWVQNDL